MNVKFILDPTCISPHFPNERSVYFTILSVQEKSHDAENDHNCLQEGLCFSDKSRTSDVYKPRCEQHLSHDHPIHTIERALFLIDSFQSKLIWNSRIVITIYVKHEFKTMKMLSIAET